MAVGEAIVVICIIFYIIRLLLCCWWGIERSLIISSEHSTALGVSSTAVLIVALGNGLLLPLHMILMLGVIVFPEDSRLRVCCVNSGIVCVGGGLLFIVILLNVSVICISYITLTRDNMLKNC